MSQSTHTTILNGRFVEMYENSYQDDYTTCATDFMEKQKNSYQDDYTTCATDFMEKQKNSYQDDYTTCATNFMEKQKKFQLSQQRKALVGLWASLLSNSGGM
jgi:hypothetical protein